MFTVTGFVPTILYNQIPHFDELYAKGSDINIDINKDGKQTHLTAITLGNGTWDIDELDDSANLFPEYSEGDVISLDVLKKLFLQYNELNQSYHIFSFNALGTVKYGIKDTTNKVRNKLGFLTDDLNGTQALNFIQKYYPGAKLHEMDLYKKKDGKIYKTLFSSEGKYYILCLLRNGNKLRFVDDDDYEDTPILSVTDPNQALEVYNNYPETEVEEDNVIEEATVEDTNENVQFDKLEIEEAFKSEMTNLDSFRLICYDNVKKDYEYKKQPTAIAVILFMQDDVNNLGYQKFYKDKNDIVQVAPKGGYFYEIKNESEVQNAVNKTIEGYTTQSGKKPNIGNLNLAQGLKKKKSKYNGKNVTGYEDGSLSPIANNILESV